MPRRTRKRSISYNSLEARKMLSASGGAQAHFDPASSTLFIQAVNSNESGADFVSDISLSIDDSTNEIVLSEANQSEQRFDASNVTRISYFGTFFNDRFSNETSIDSRLAGYAGDDVLEGGEGADRIIGGNGNDELLGGAGDDYLSGNKGNDQLIDNRPEDGGRDRFFGGIGLDTILAGSGNDFIVGGDQTDTIEAGSGNDFVLGGEGDDSVDAGEGNDVVYAGAGNDTVVGGLGIDRLLGQDGSDQIQGNEDNDFLDGGIGNDVLLGGDGDDRLIGDHGNDYLIGQGGSDKIISASPTVLDSSFGYDYIDTGLEDGSQDTVIRHRYDYVVSRSDDQFVDVSVIRARAQAAFLTTNIANPGWLQTTTGLQYKTIHEGSGSSPASTDRVRVNYTGSFIDGTVFDSNGPIEFNLNQVISGWTEGLQLMTVGSTYEFAIPMELGYGEHGSSSGSIPGYTTLLFTVELLAIV